SMVNIAERYDAGVRLLKKHGVQKTNELLQIQQELQSRLAQAQLGEDQLKTWEETVKVNYEKVKQLGQQLHLHRTKAVAAFSKSVTQSIHKMGMLNAQFRVQLTAKETPDSNGFNQIS